ncbi:MAG: hypothetical protein GX968_00870 [Tissierellia bacterium]|nr:hypothetical protein [Tissierellia bacterium]
MSKEIDNNLTLKIFAIIIAIILRSYVMSKENPPRTKPIRNVVVNFTNIESLEQQHLVIMDPKIAKINVELSGKANNLKSIDEKDILATVDLSGYKEGDVKVPVYVEVPSDVKLVDYSPKEILFKFEKIVKEEHLITLETVGELPKGYILGEAEIRPQSIYIEGPRSWVDSVSGVVAEVELDDKVDDIKALVPINLVNSKGEDVRGLEQEENFVDIFIPVYHSKTVPIELQTEGQLPDNHDIVDIKIEPATVNIKGKKEDLKHINSISTRILDINSLVGKRNVLVELDLPEKVDLVDPNQQVTITLNIDESKSKTFNYTLKDINIKNLDPQLKIDEADLEQGFEVVLVGIAENVDVINKEDLFIEIDLKDLEEGTHKVDLNIREEAGILSMDIIPKSLDIKLLKE